MFYVDVFEDSDSENDELDVVDGKAMKWLTSHLPCSPDHHTKSLTHLLVKEVKYSVSFTMNDIFTVD